MMIRGRYVGRLIVTLNNLDNVRFEISNETGPSFESQFHTGSGRPSSGGTPRQSH